MSGPLLGTGALVRFVLRRDRWILPVWVAVAVLIPVGLASPTQSLYPTTEALHSYAETSMANTATVAMRGLIYAPTLGGVVAWGAGMSSALVFTLANLLTVLRHTRAEEESGRLELLGSTGVGRFANLTAVLTVVAIADVVAGSLLALALIGIGLAPGGSLVLGLSSAAVGFSMAAVAALAGQLVAGAGAARGLTFGVLVGLYALRAVGDVQGGSLAWLSWLSPFGWARLTLAFTGDRWWVFGLFLTVIAVLTTLAYGVLSRRDITVGLLPEAPGRERAPAGLRSVLALAWREHRSTLLAWAVAYAVLGVLIGLAAGGASTEQFGGVFTGADALFSFLLLILSQAASGFAILAVLRGDGQERRGLAELLLSYAPSRFRWAAAHLAFAVGGPLLLLALGGAGMARASEDPGATMVAALVWLPAVWSVAAVAIALWGWFPRLAAPVAWALLVAFLLLELGVEFGRLDDSLLALSPFSHVPRVLLGAEFAAGPLLALVVIAAGLTGIGLLGIRRRDIR